MGLSPAARPWGRLLVPGISTAVMLAVLVALGVWQLERRAWKADLLARIDDAERHAAIDLPPNPDPFIKARVSGTLRPDLQARYGVALRGEVLGAFLIAPLERPGQTPLLVDLGWVPLHPTVPVALPDGVIEGYVRPAERAGMFAARDNVVERLFYTLDPAVIGAALGLPKVAPFVLVAMGTAASPAAPQPAEALPRPPDNHLQYAFTWFGFAVTLVIVFALYARKALRR